MEYIRGSCHPRARIAVSPIIASRKLKKELPFLMTKIITNYIGNSSVSLGRQDLKDSNFATGFMNHETARSVAQL
jgi:hypothetical protein